MPRIPWHERTYAALLRLFPSEFRGDFGDEMREDFRDQRLEMIATGRRRSTARLWLRTGADALNRAPREHFDVLRRDAVHATRLLRRRPGLSVSALLTLALGIGLNTAVFSLVSGVLWRGLPFADSDRLVRLFQTDGSNPARDTTSVAPANVIDWKEAGRTLDGIASMMPSDQTLLDGGDRFLSSRSSSSAPRSLATLKPGRKAIYRAGST